MTNDTVKRILSSTGVDSHATTEIISKSNKVISVKLLDKGKEVAVDLTSDEQLNPLVTQEFINALVSKNRLLSRVMLTADKEHIIPLSQMFSFVGGESGNDYTEVNRDSRGVTLWDMLHDNDVINYLRTEASKMYPNVNPQTGTPDFTLENQAITKPEYALLATLSGAMQPQYQDESVYFNPMGTITVGELLDSLVAFKSGSTNGVNSKKSLDNISDVGDYYNEGYNLCLSGLSSPFYRLYTKAELNKPITRAELAYIVVVCWSEFTEKYGAINMGTYTLGINVDWDTPQRYIGKFEDAKSGEYKVYKKVYNTELGVITSIDVNDYKEELSMSDFVKQMKEGTKAIPLPMFMSLVELDALDLFAYEGTLKALNQVSRAELAYFIIKLARLFNTPYLRYDNDNYTKDSI